MELTNSGNQIKEKLETEIKELNAQKMKMQNELEELGRNEENTMILVNSLEQKIKQITNEKKDYEFLLTKYHD